MKKLLLPLLVFGLFTLSKSPASYGQHTFSIVAIDSLTGEIGSAGATCGDSIIWPGTPGAYIISDVIPGTGAIHTQAYWQPSNQAAAHNRMLAGDSPEQIIQYMINNDVQSNPHIRQYGVVDYNNGSPRSAAYTGVNCMDYKGHITGPGYSIQGNILLGPQILDSMENRFLNTPGMLSDKLMAALQGAKVIGADSRCTPDSVSALSAFIRVAKPTDHPDSLFLDINVAGTDQWVDPIDVVQTRYDNWLVWLSVDDNADLSNYLEISPNPSDDAINLKWRGQSMRADLQLVDLQGKTLHHAVVDLSGEMQIRVADWPDGLYLLRLNTEGRKQIIRKILVRH